MLEIIFLCQTFILLLQSALAGANSPPSSSQWKGAPIVDTCQANLIEERFEGFSTLRYSYFAESTGICEDQVNATQCHRKKLKFEEKNMQSSEAVLGLNFE